MRFEAGRAAGAEEPGIALAIVGGFGRRLGCREVEQAADRDELGLAVRVGEKAEVADPAKPSGKTCSKKRRMNSPAGKVMTLGLCGCR